MAYIPTIHTFEDDVNENRGFDEAPISGGLDKIGDNNILVPEKRATSVTKKILTLISVLFILGSVSALGYYFYNSYKAKQLEANLNNTAEVNMNSQNVDNNTSDLKNIFPSLEKGMAPYIETVTSKNNIIILTIKTNTDNNVDNYSLLYAYILAHTRDLNSDLFSAFKIDDLAKNTENEDFNYTEESATGTNITSTSSSSTLERIGNEINNISSKIVKPTPISSQELVWETKTLKNQDFSVTTAGVINLVYGYVGEKYLIFTTSLKDFFDTVDSLQ